MLTSDKRLISLAINQMSLSQIHDNPVKDIVRKDKLTENDRLALVEFITPTLEKKQPSMSEMKSELLKIIGYPPGAASYSNTLNVKEMQAIYNYFKAKLIEKSNGK